MTIYISHPGPDFEIAEIFRVFASLTLRPGLTQLDLGRNRLTELDDISESGSLNEKDKVKNLKL